MRAGRCPLGTLEGEYRAKVGKSLLCTFGAQCPFLPFVYVKLFDQLHQFERPRVSSFERLVSSMCLEMFSHR